ncbi:DUF1566 domain-containing protein [bacterium]|nr:DUF1566 domain-containing protein [bacterium]
MPLRLLSLACTLGLMLLAGGALAEQICKYDSITATAPASRFTDNGDGTVTDQVNGLQWKRCSEGQTWDGTTCTGDPTDHTWQEALQLADGANYAGVNDWRLPNFKELFSIIEQACSDPYIDLAVFPGTPGYSDFWSASPYALDPDYAWYENFGGGAIGIGPTSKGSAVFVRLVRGGQDLGPLNDTGIDWWADGSTNSLTSEPVGYPGQDASYGRDKIQHNDADGHAGFHYTKLDSDGNTLPATAATWSCVRDEVTGLVWENKTSDAGLHSYGNTYSWYNPDSATNGGAAGYRNFGDCTGGTDCDTLGFTQAVNQAGLCGANDWRLPSSEELLSLVDGSRSYPAIDPNYFLGEGTFWSASPFANSSEDAWYVYVGIVYISPKFQNWHVRLVRGGQALPVVGLSCTTNTLGLPLDQTACFYDRTDDWRQAILKKAGVVVATASLAGNEGGFCAGNLLWLDAAGKPISDWSALFGTANTVAVEISAVRPDGTTRVLGALTASRSQFGVDVTADQTFPMSGPQAIATFTATPSGGTAPYTYAWSEVLDYLEGYGDNDWGTAASATIELPAYGEKYQSPALTGRWGAINDLHPINLRVTDSTGKLATVQCLAAVTNPHLNGNPALSGSGSQLQRGVDLASGNYHLSATDLSVSGKGPDFVLTRAYNSNVKDNGAWTFNLDLSLYFSAHSMGRELTVGPREDGREQRYYRELDGPWHALNPGNFDQLTQASDGHFVLYTQGNLLYRFAAPEGAGAGRLEAIADRDNNVLQFTHTANRITGATTAGGDKYSILREGGRIKRVTDFTGRYVEYTRNADGMITAVRNPLGKLTKYAYTTGSAPADRYKLVSITDPRDKVQATIAYNIWGAQAKPEEPCPVTAVVASGQKAGSVCSVSNGIDEAWRYLYGTHETDVIRQVTRINRPAVNGVSNNIAFILDDARTRVVERIDSLNVNEFLNKTSRTTFKSTANRTRIAETALPVETLRPSDAKTTIAYTDDGAGNPEKITETTKPLTGEPLTRETISTFGTVTGQTNLTPRASVKRPGVTTTTRYSDFKPSGKPETIIDPLEQTTLRHYNAIGQLDQATNARGIRTTLTYDAKGRPKRTTDALGNYTEQTYDTLGRLTSERDARGLVTSHTYDANGNLLKTTNPAGGITTNTYDAADNLISTKDPRGYTTTYEYDAIGRKVAERYTVGGQARVRGFTYDAMGRLMRVTNENGQSSDTRFDPRGKVLQEIDPLSQTISYTYDPNGNVLTVTDAAGRQVTTTYDALDRKTRVTDALNNFEEYTYNDQGLLASRRDARGQMTWYSYDAIGQLTKVADDEGDARATYDPNGNLTSTTDRKGQTTTYTYDVLDRLTRLTDATGRQWGFTYDANGNRLTRTLPSGQITSYTYDKLDRVISVSYPGGPKVTYTYDANGNRLTMTDTNGVTKYVYDEQNRLTKVTDAFGNAVAYGYDPAGLLQQLLYPGNKLVTYTRDAAGQLKDLTDWLNQTTRYTRDPAGAVTDILYGNGALVHKGYDAVGRLTSLINSTAANTIISSHTLRLDGLGNPLSADLELPLEPARLGKSAEALYDAANRLTSVDGAAITHDSDGRTTADNSGSAAIQYAFNAQDLITSVTAGGILTDRYTYDGDGRRVARTTGAQTTRYVLDPTGGDLYALLAETDSANKPLRYYLYGEGLVAQIFGTSHRYYHFDQTGNTLALTDDNGALSDAYAYSPFGESTARGNTTNPFRFVGRYGVMDDGNGTNYMRARYYRPDIGRFLSLDKLLGAIADPQALNRYAYVKGNPIGRTDPSGNIDTSYGSTYYEIANGYVKLVSGIGNVLRPTAHTDFGSKVIYSVLSDTLSYSIYAPAQAIVDNAVCNNNLTALGFVWDVGTTGLNAGLDIPG